MEFFSKEWFEAFTAIIKKDDAFQKKSVGFDSNVHFKVLKDSKAKLGQDVEFGMWLPDGEPNWFGNKAASDVDIILEGKGGTYSEIFQGKRNVVMALTMGKIKLRKGNLGKLMGNLGTVHRFVELAGQAK